MTPTADTPSRRDLLFGEAIALPPTEREPFLELACAADSALRDELISLVRAHEDAERFFNDLSRSWIMPLRGEGASRLSVGSRIGRYEVTGVLGEGGMGVVYRGWDPELERDVALKMLPRDAVPDAEARAALLAEARAVARIDHPHVGVIHEVGETEDAGVFIAMACHDGETLADRLRRGPLPLPAPEVLRIARQLTSALEAAHAAGIVHRDVKPSNVLLTGGDGLRLVDFGIAGALGSAAARRGSKGYMSPEATAGTPADVRDDLWSLGVLLHELATGVRPPAPREGLPAVDAVAARGELPPALLRGIGACLAPDPEDRPPSAAAFGAMMAATDEGRTVGVRPRPLAVGGAVLGALLIGGLVWNGVSGGARDGDGDDSGTVLGASAGMIPVGGFPDRVLVLPFEDRSGDPEFAAVGDIAADWLTDGISRAGITHVVQATTAMAAARETRDPVTLAGNYAANLVVTGSYIADGDSLRLTARLVDGSTGTLLRAMDPAVAPRSRPLVAIEALRQGIVTAVAMQVDPLMTPYEWAVIAEPPVWEAYLAYNRAKEHFVEGRMGPAREETVEAERRDPDFLLPIFLGALAAANLGDYDDLEARRNRLTPHLERADGAIRLGYDFLQAILAGSHEASYRNHRRWVDQGILVPGTMGHAQLVQDAVKLNRLEEAIEVARQVTPIRGEIRSWHAFWSAWSMAHYGLGEYEESLRVARLAREVLGAARIDALWIEMRALVALGDFDGLAVVVDEAVRRSPTPADFPRQTGEMLEIHGHSREAAARYEEAIMLARTLVAEEPSNARHGALAVALLAVGTPAAAAEADAILREMMPDAEQAGVNLVPYFSALGRAAILRGDTIAALAWSERLAGVDPTWQFGRHLYEQARIAARLGDPDRMLDLLIRANRSGTQVYFLARSEPALMSYRNDPGMADFLRPR